MSQLPICCNERQNVGEAPGDPDMSLRWSSDVATIPSTAEQVEGTQSLLHSRLQFFINFHISTDDTAQIGP